MTSKDYEVGLALKRELPSDAQFVAFGNDWSSTLAYISEHKSFSVPRWFKNYQDAMTHPERYVEPSKLGALIYCYPTDQELHNLLDWSTRNRGWKIGLLHECYIATKDKPYHHGDATHSSCKATINLDEIHRDENTITLAASGWAITQGNESGKIEDLYVKLHNKKKPITRQQILITPAPKNNTSVERKDATVFGFSRILYFSIKEEAPEVTVTLIKDGVPEDCDPAP